MSLQGVDFTFQNNNKNNNNNKNTHLIFHRRKGTRCPKIGTKTPDLAYYNKLFGQIYQRHMSMQHLAWGQ